MSRTPKKRPTKNQTIGLYAVQCGECLKWRLVPTKEEYEEIRGNFVEDPWFCTKKPGVSCDDPADLEYDTSRFWVIDKPNIPKPPAGLERHMTMRGDYSKLDVHYVMPTGRRVRGPGEVQKYLDAFPQYKGQMSVSDFSFAVPKILEDMQPKAHSKGSASSSKKTKRAREEDDDE